MSRKPDLKYIDRKPTQIPLEDGSMGTPDKEGRFSIAHFKDDSKEYRYDNKPVDLQDFFGAMCGKEKIPGKISGFRGMGEGQLRRAYETKDEYDRRMKEN